MAECVCICTGLPYIICISFYLDTSYTIIYLHMWWNIFLSNSCETVVSIELTYKNYYNGVTICICMHGATEEKNSAIHAYTNVFLDYL